MFNLPDPTWYETCWNGDPMGRTAEAPHPLVALGLLLSSALLIGLLAIGHTA